MDWRAVLDFVKTHASAFAFAFTWGSIAWVYFRNRTDWKRKKFTARVNFSLNYVVGGKLAMRTLLETPAATIWLNEIGVKRVLKAAKKTRIDQPFVLLPHRSDMDFMYRAILNAMSERFAGAFVAQAMGAPVRSAEFLYAVTFERFKEIRTLKLRVMLVERSLLENGLAPENVEKIETDGIIYTQRMETLRRMHQLHADSQKGGRYSLGSIELAIPSAS